MEEGRRPVIVLVAVAALIASACSSEPGSTQATPTGLSSSPSASAPPSPAIAITALQGKILFTRAGGRFGDETVFTADADGRNEQRVTGFGTQCCPRWTPDGTHILISALAADGERITAGIIDQAGSHERTMPLPQGTLNLGPGPLSPDGTRIALEGWDDARSGRQGIYIARPSDGGALVRVTRCTKAQDDRPMDFSPDGSEIYFFRAVARFPRVTDEPLGSLFVVNVDGTGLRQVTPPDVPVEVVGNAGGRLSHDGRWIAFTSSGVLWKIHPDGSGLTKVFEDPAGGLAITPTWSPDGAFILFGLDPAGSYAVTNTAPPNGLYVIRPDGTDLTPIVISGDWKREPEWTASS